MKIEINITNNFDNFTISGGQLVYSSKNYLKFPPKTYSDWLSNVRLKEEEYKRFDRRFYKFPWLKKGEK